MTTIYQRLSLLGFAEWLEKNDYATWDVNEYLKSTDEDPIESFRRTSLNALAFRWLREEKGIDVTIKAVYPFDYNDGYPKKVYVGFFVREKKGDEYVNTENGLAHNHFANHPQAEIACLEKAAEIIEQNK
jgi:hypothetical protein